MEVVTGDDVHADDGIVIAKVSLVNFLIGNDIACRQGYVHEIGVALGLSADACHATLPEAVGMQFADKFRGEDGGVAARVPHGSEGFHPPRLVEGDELALGDNLIGQRAEVYAKASHSVRRSNSSMVKISLLGLSVLPLRRTLAEMTRAVRPLLLFVAVIVAITYTNIMITGAKVQLIFILSRNPRHKSAKKMQ